MRSRGGILVLKTDFWGEFTVNNGVILTELFIPMKKTDYMPANESRGANIGQ